MSGRTVRSRRRGSAGFLLRQPPRRSHALQFQTDLRCMAHSGPGYPKNDEEYPVVPKVSALQSRCRDTDRSGGNPRRALRLKGVEPTEPLEESFLRPSDQRWQVRVGRAWMQVARKPLLALPAHFPDQRNKFETMDIPLLKRFAGFGDHAQILCFRICNRDDQPSTVGELADERVRYLWSCGCDDDPVIRGKLSPSDGSVAALRCHSISQLFKKFSGLKMQLHMALYCEHTASKFGKHHRLIPRTRADLQYFAIRLRVELFRHERNGVRLGDRLTARDRKSRVFVRLPGKWRQDEKLALNLAESFQYAFVADSL